MQGTPAPLVERFWEKVANRGGDGCWTWTAYTDKDGYGSIGEGGSKGRNLQSHRASWLIHFGEPPSELMVLHSCDNPPCVRPDHLFLGTAKINYEDMVAKGRRVIHKKLTSIAVIEVASLYGKMSYTEIANKFGVARTTVSNIMRGKSRIDVTITAPAVDDPAAMFRRRTKLNEEAVRYIRNEVASGRDQAELCRELGMSPASISRIVNRVRWKRVS